MQMFSRENVGVFMDAGALGTEKRKKYEEDKVFKVTLRIPLTPELCSDLVPGDGQIKAALYAAAIAGDVRPFLRSTVWNMVVPPQRLEVSPTPDSPVTMTYDYVKISKVFQAKVNGTNADLYVRIVIGGVGPKEREALAAWHRNQAFVTFYECDTTLQLAGDAMTDADEKARAPRLAPMWDDPVSEETAEALVQAATGGAAADGHRYPDTSKKRKQRRAAKAVATPTTDQDDDENDD